jgi:hypothetical protein
MSKGVSPALAVVQASVGAFTNITTPLEGEL